MRPADKIRHTPLFTASKLIEKTKLKWKTNLYSARDVYVNKLLRNKMISCFTNSMRYNDWNKSTFWIKLLRFITLYWKVVVKNQGRVDMISKRPHSMGTIVDLVLQRSIYFFTWTLLSYHCIIRLSKCVRSSLALVLSIKLLKTIRVSL